MSVRLYTQEEIVNHLENSSLSKYMYSFGKANRFYPIDKNGKSDELYILPSMKMIRKAGIGYGKKYDFTLENYRGTEFLSLKRIYDPNYSPGYKYSFGLGREKFKKQGYLGYIDGKTPGPGRYEAAKTLGVGTPKYSLRKLCGETFWINRHMNNPSPAHYNLKSCINKRGKFMDSKIADIKGAAFSMDNTKRFHTINSKYI
jgi:hypothetical protein